MDTGSRKTPCPTKMYVAYCQGTICARCVLAALWTVRLGLTKVENWAKHWGIVICGPFSSEYFFALSHKRRDFGKKKLLNTKCVFWFSLQFCVKHFSFEGLSEMWSKLYVGLHVRWLLLSQCNETWIFVTGCQNILLRSNLMKIHPVGAELFRADSQSVCLSDRQTDWLTDSQTETDIQTDRDRQTDRHTHTDRDRQTDRHTQTHTHTDRHNKANGRSSQLYKLA